MVKAGDIISCSGKGRCEVKAVDVTKKERFAVQMVRYIQIYVGSEQLHVSHFGIDMHIHMAIHCGQSDTIRQHVSCWTQGLRLTVL